MLGAAVTRGGVLGIMLIVVAGCSTGPAGEQIRTERLPGPFSGAVVFDRNFSPVEKPALAKGFHPSGDRRPAEPGVYVCKRVPRVPCGRMMAATGFYHQWIYTQAMERGVGFVGADYNHFAGLPRPIWNVFKPLAVVDHSGAVLKSDTLIKKVTDLQPERVEPLMGLRSTGNYFPLANCQRWVNETLHAARRGTDPR